MIRQLNGLISALALMASTTAIAQEHQFINPSSLFDTSVLGYTQLVSSSNEGQTNYVSGQTATGNDGSTIGKTVGEQIPVAFENLRKAIEAAGAQPEHVVKIQVLFTEPYTPKNLPLLRKEIKNLFGDKAPANTLFVVSQLAVPEYVFEVDAIIVKP